MSLWDNRDADHQGTDFLWLPARDGARKTNLDCMEGGYIWASYADGLYLAFPGQSSSLASSRDSQCMNQMASFITIIVRLARSLVLSTPKVLILVSNLEHVWSEIGASNSTYPINSMNDFHSLLGCLVELIGKFFQRGSFLTTGSQLLCLLLWEVDKPL
jgi:hypothetical protein